MTSQYFNNYNNNLGQQRLIEDLFVQAIQINGLDVLYLPNTNDAARDLVYGEDPLKTFTQAYEIEIYINENNQFGGEREFFSKFGLEIRNDLSVVMAKRTFAQRVEANYGITRPREGDLIYIPVLNGTGQLYEIKFVNQNRDMDMFGRKLPFVYEMNLEQFKYSQETLATGIGDIDIISVFEDTPTLASTEKNTYNNVEIGNEANTFINKNTVNTFPFGKFE